MSSPTHTRSDVPSQGQAHAADISAAPASLNEAPPTVGWNAVCAGMCMTPLLGMWSGKLHRVWRLMIFPIIGVARSVILK